MPTDRAPLETAAGRLDSWKEIAAHLRRDVRTVQRWHQRAGLPVHRHVDAKQRGVFAFQAELDAWANQFREETDNAEQAVTVAEQATSHGPGSRRWFVAGGVLAAVGVLTVALLHRQAAPSLPFQVRSWLLVAAVDDHTDRGDVDESLHYTLERELAASSFLSVVPRLRIQDDLRLMRQPADSRITPALARELAVRDGNIQAIVAGRLERAGAGDQLTIEIIDPRTGVTVRTRTEQLSSRSELLGGVRRVADWARSTLGETLAVSPAATRLPQVTTASLAALQLYAKAENAIAAGQEQAARVLLESAVREDPDFAMAHSRLGSVLFPGDMFEEHAEKAMALSSHATERERLRIIGDYHLQHHQADKARAAYEALARLDPDDWDAHVSLAFAYHDQRRDSESIREMERAAQLRPNDFTTTVYTAQAWALWFGQPERARPYVEHARALWPAQDGAFSSEIGPANLPPPHAREVAWVLMFPAYDRWQAGDIKGMLATVRQVLDSNPFPTPADRDALLTIAAGFEMTAGRLKDTQVLSEQVFQTRIREYQFAVMADAVDDFVTLRRHMLHVPTFGDARALRWVRAGLYAQAEFVMTQDWSNEGFTETARGELALRRGHLAEAVERLQHGVDLASTNTLSERYLGAESLNRALQRLGRDDEALKVLETAAAAVPRYTRTGTSGAFWLRVLDRLSQAYRGLGRTAEAEAIDTRLRHLLAEADADHPLVLALARRRE